MEILYCKNSIMTLVKNMIPKRFRGKFTCKEKCELPQNEIAYRFIWNFGITIVLLLRPHHEIRTPFNTSFKESNNMAIKKIFQSNNKLL